MDKLNFGAYGKFNYDGYGKKMSTIDNYHYLSFPILNSYLDIDSTSCTEILTVAGFREIFDECIGMKVNQKLCFRIDSFWIPDADIDSYQNIMLSLEWKNVLLNEKICHVIITVYDQYAGQELIVQNATIRRSTDSHNTYIFNGKITGNKILQLLLHIEIQIMCIF